MTRHAELQRDIPEYVASQLADDRRRQIERHLATCEECRELLAIAEAIAVGVRRRAGAQEIDHVAPDRLRLFATEGPAGLDDVAAHVESCDGCALELEAHRRSSGAPPAPAPGAVGTAAPPRRRIAWLQLAAGLAAGAALAWIALPWISPDPTESVPAGPLALIRVASPQRGADLAPVRIDPTGANFVLLVELPVLRDGDGSTGYRIEVRTADGTVTWAGELTRDEVIERAEGTQFANVAFGIPVDRHPAGEYAVRVAIDGREGLQPILHLPFEVFPEVAR